jgi:thiopeptide-type bacteriocin biosynthesis protein
MMTAAAAPVLHQNFFHLRMPILPASVFSAWLDAPDRAHFVFEQFKSPTLREALFLASPNLYERLVARELAAVGGPGGTVGTITLGNTQLQAHGLQHAPVEPKMLAALSRYLARAAYRGTPFGMFSTVTTGRIAGATDFDRIDTARLVRSIQYDAAIEQQLLTVLAAIPEVKQKLSFSTNASVRDMAGAFYFIEQKRGPQRARYLLSRLEKNDALAFAVDSARHGIRLHDLGTAIAAACEVDLADAAEYVDQLVDMQVLVPDLRLPISGGSRMLGLHDQLHALGEQAHTAPLAHLLTRLREQADGGAANLVEGYQEAYALLRGCGLDCADRDTVFQVDCRRDFPVTLGESTVDDILASAHAMARFMQEPPNDLAEHKQRFRERFDDQEVPLELALHNEFGVPFPLQNQGIVDLLEGVNVRGAQAHGLQPHNVARNRVLTACLERALRAGENTVHLTEADVDAVAAPGDNRSFVAEGRYALATLYEGAGSGDPAFRVHLVAGRSGGEMLGRFTSIDDVLLGHVRDLFQRQQAQDGECIYAEVVHRNGGRVDNVVTRPNLREYDIVYMGDSSLDQDHQIPVSDLTLRLVDGQYRLRSVRLNKEIVPRSTTAHNFSQGVLSIYQFLCSLQYQDCPGGVAFDWPAAFSSIKRLPRVCYRNSVWASAVWRLDAEDLGALRRASANPDDLRQWRESLGLPRFVTIDMSDNSLPIDFDNPVLVAMLMEEISEAQAATLTESISLNAQASGDGQLAGTMKEVVIPFLPRTTEAEAVKRAPLPPYQPLAQRDNVFLPGSEWSYYKLYCSELNIDNIVVQTVAPLLQRAQARGLIDDWFFVRYADPNRHVRVRFRAPVAAHRHTVDAELTAALAPLLATSVCSKVMMDMYEQETSRYGGTQAMTLAERLFTIDSSLVADLLLLREQCENAPSRWLLALLGIELWLDAFGFTPEECVSLMGKLADEFKAEFGVRAQQKVQLGAKYRGYRADIDRYFFGAGDVAHAQPLLARMRHAQTGMRDVIGQLRTLDEGGGLTVPMTSFAGAILHMHCNRMLDQQQRKQEMVLYDFMVRILASRQSRKPRAAATVAPALA